MSWDEEAAGPVPQDSSIMNWDDAIESDGQELVLLPEGDYTFTVTGFERGRFPGSAKIPPCNKASLTLSIDNDQGPAIVRVDLIRYRTLEWKIAAFFRCIGQKKHGEKVTMDWSRVQGARGRAHLRPRTYIRDGEERQVNDVDRFYDFDPAAMYTEIRDADLPWENGGS